MARSSRYFTPLLSMGERDKILDMLGIGNEVFDFTEVAGGKVLLSQKWNQGELETLAPLTRVEGSVLVHVSINVDQLANEILAPTITPFEEILPYPFNRILVPKQLIAESITIGPAEFSESIQQLRVALIALEQSMSEAELSCLWIRNGSERMPLLFHFVRKKLIRVGTLPSLSEIGQQYDLGLLTPSALRQFFGTSVAFFVLDIEPDGSPRPFSEFNRLQCAIESCLSLTGSVVRAASPIHSALTDGDLGL